MAERKRDGGQAARSSSVDDDSSSPPQELVDRIRSSLSGRYSAEDSWSIKMIHEKRLTGRQHRLFRARDRETGRTIAIKADSVTRRNREQYGALRSLRQKTEACVSPLYLAHDDRFFAMEWIEAPLLVHELHGPARHEALALAGDWLARLQSATMRSPIFCMRRHKLRLSDGKEDAAAQRAFRGILTRMKRVSRRLRRVSMLRGDFHPANLFYTGAGILAFDRQFDKYGPPFYDVATFLLDVELIRQIAEKSGSPHPGDIEADRQAFFDGYGPLQERDLALYDLVEDVVLSQKWRNDRLRGKNWRDDLMKARGLLELDDRRTRPGRPVAAPAGTHWTQEPAAVPRTRLFYWLGR